MSLWLKIHKHHIYCKDCSALGIAQKNPIYDSLDICEDDVQLRRKGIKIAKMYQLHTALDQRSGVRSKKQAIEKA
ncbi:MAG: hypothetical protein ABL930_12910 [Pseudobdellovibrio sp.]